MNVFISGGCKNGKSFHAQKLAKDMAQSMAVPLYYIATMKPRDEEDEIRIRRHRDERRGWGFRTLEQPVDICSCLDRPDVDPSGVFLLDSVTALMAEEMFSRHFDEGVMELTSELLVSSGEKVRRDLLRFAELTGNCIFVSDFIYAGTESYAGMVRRSAERLVNEGSEDAVNTDAADAGKAGAYAANASKAGADAADAGEAGTDAADAGKAGAYAANARGSDADGTDAGEREPDFTELYLKALAAADRSLASVCGSVMEVVYGNVMEYKQHGTQG